MSLVIRGSHRGHPGQSKQAWPYGDGVRSYLSSAACILGALKGTCRNQKGYDLDARSRFEALCCHLIGSSCAWITSMSQGIMSSYVLISEAWSVSWVWKPVWHKILNTPTWNIIFKPWHINWKSASCFADLRNTPDISISAVLKTRVDDQNPWEESGSQRA